MTQSNKKKHNKNSRPRMTAEFADKHQLYEISVQSAEADVDFIKDTFTAERGRAPMTLREDFCGTGKLCATWVQTDPERGAVGLDLDEETLEWGTRHNVAPLGEATERVTLLQRDVLNPGEQRSDAVVAFNFSYCIFKERRTLLEYFKKVRSTLNEDGAFFLDIHGGTECHESLEEEKEFDGFDYIWDQEPYDAIGGLAFRYIHFRFEDGTELREAFTYDWRLWSLPELKDLMLEAGFSSAQCYWEGDDGDGEGNGVFEPMDKAENEVSWVAYLVGFA